MLPADTELRIPRAFSVQQTRPEYRPSHVSHVAPVHSGRQGSTDDAAYACSRYHCGFDADLAQGFDHADMSESAHSAATQSQANAFVLK